MEDAGEKLKEIRQVLHEMEKLREQERTLTARIAALAGLTGSTEQRKPRKKSLSNAMFLDACRQTMKGADA